jgi:hypothetical protein
MSNKKAAAAALAVGFSGYLRIPPPSSNVKTSSQAPSGATLNKSKKD